MPIFEFLLLLLLFLIVILLVLNLWNFYQNQKLKEEELKKAARKIKEVAKYTRSSDSEDNIEVLDLRPRRRRNSGSSANSRDRYSSGFPSTVGDLDDSLNDCTCIRCNHRPSSVSPSMFNPGTTTLIDPMAMLQMQAFQNRQRYGEDPIGRLARALNPNHNTIEDVIDLTTAALPPAIRLISRLMRDN